MRAEIVPMGRFGSPHGVKGWISVISYSRPPDKIFDYGAWHVDHGNGWQSLSIVEFAVWSKKLVVLPEGINNRSQIEPWVNCEIGVNREMLPELEESEGYYWHDLIGLTVKNKQGFIFGQVESLMATGANDILVVKDQAHKKEHLIPFVRPHIVQSVDIKAKLIVLDWEPL